MSESASPGQVSNTPSPPSSSEALPDPVIKETSELETDQTKSIETNNEGRFAYPVNGKIIRDYVKNKQMELIYRHQRVLLSLPPKQVLWLLLLPIRKVYR